MFFSFSALGPILLIDWPPILRYPYLLTDPKIIPEAPLAPIYSNFEGRARQKKHGFLVKIFQKKPENVFFWRVFQKLNQNRVFLVLWKSSENQFCRPKKDRQNFRKCLENPPMPPRENPKLDPPL